MNRRLPILCLAAMALFALGAAFLFLPDGWNFIPLMLAMLVLASLLNRPKAKRCPADTRLEEPIPARDRGNDPSGPTSSPSKRPVLARRANRAFGPILAGVIIDCVDFATFGPVGLVLGFPVGGLAGYWMGRSLGFDKRAAWWCALAAGLYCTLPGTELIPLATILGACVRFRESGTPSTPP